jgi:hypothetical protein
MSRALSGKNGLCPKRTIDLPVKPPLKLLFLAITSYSVLITAVFIGDPRYHYALVPLAAVFSVKALRMTSLP